MNKNSLVEKANNILNKPPEMQFSKITIIEKDTMFIISNMVENVVNILNSEANVFL